MIHNVIDIVLIVGRGCKQDGFRLLVFSLANRMGRKHVVIVKYTPKDKGNSVAITAAIVR